jgi:hypothetical protein
MIHISAAAIAPEINPNIKTILVIVFPPMSEECKEKCSEAASAKRMILLKS